MLFQTCNHLMKSESPFSGPKQARPIECVIAGIQTQTFHIWRPKLSMMSYQLLKFLLVKSYGISKNYNFQGPPT